MSYRLTVALDALTVQRIQSLAIAWDVSPSEVIRRAVALLEPEERPDPIELLRLLHEAGEGLSEQKAVEYLDEVRDSRQTLRGR